MLLSTLVAVGAGYLLWLTVLYFAQDWMLFPRSLANGRYEPAPADVEVWQLAHADGVTTEAMFLAARGPATDAGAPTVVLVHGNAMLMQDWLDWGYDLAERGWNVLIPEFRGYGRSGGTPVRAALVGDMLDALSTLRADPRVDPERIALYGRSIGGMIAAEVAVKLEPPPAALIAHTTPATIADLARRYGAPAFLLRSPFDAESALRTLRASAGDACTVVVIAHRGDEIVPVAHGERLASAAGTTLVLVDGDHNSVATSADERVVADAIGQALARARNR